MRALMLVYQWNRSGGLENVTVETVRTLTALGVRVEVCSIHDPPGASVDQVVATGLAPHKRAVHSVYFRWLWKARLRRFLELHAGQFDLIIVGHAYLLPVVRSTLETVEVKRPQCWVWAYGREVWGEPGARLATDLSWADKVVSISNFTTQCLIDNRVNSEKIVLIPPSIDISLFTPVSEPTTIDRHRILCVGRLSSGERYKGQDVLIEAVNYLPSSNGKPVNLSIVGAGDDLVRLRALVYERGLQNRVAFLGRLSLSELVRAYQTSAVFAMPSRVVRPAHGMWTGEGFGIVYIEAQACGRPVVASTDGGAPDTILPGKTGYLTNPQKPEEVADAISELLIDPDLADRMGRQGRDWVQENFSLARFQERLHRLLS